MAYLSLIGGLILLFVSGDTLVKGSVQLSRYFKLSTLVIGLTVVAFGTSAPELFVSVKAAFDGVSDLAIGNVIGSNIANIGLIIGLVSVFMPMVVANKSIVKDWGVMNLATLMLLFSVWSGFITFWEGVSFVSALAIYLVWSIVRARKSKNITAKILAPTMTGPKALGYVVIAIVGLYFGAGLLVDGAREIALSWGVSDRVIGVSIVAFGTSVPELATSMIALYRKENDISVGNIIGSNIFNIWAVLGLTSLVTPLPVYDWLEVLSDVLISAFFAVLLFLFILPLGRGIITRLKGGILLSLYFIYIFIIYSL
ncbi:calcium/sodium antiporter [Geofilum sp. OHC36d9]|uniref:calcium/sodium antiporter n=1 Tax=Geofilum sp. OHC36d9 TaxID=3458413 RepID=UPI004034A260